jgi:hypothetical protein
LEDPIGQYVPFGHWVGSTTPSLHNFPSGHKLIEDEFGQKYFSGHRLALEDPIGQYVPFGHIIGLVPLSMQYAPKGHIYFV